MILVDSRIGSKELVPYIQRMGVKSQGTQLEFGDACFEGNGPNGRIVIGVERKKIGDMLNCIEDARYAGHQRPGMLSMYDRNALIIEGVWKPDTTTGYLMECIAELTWKPYQYRYQKARYGTLFRYLLSIQIAGTIVVQSRNEEHTAYNIVELYHYFLKKWDQHTSLMETAKLNLPSLNGRPSLVRRWAADLDGIGVKHSLEAEKVFKTPLDLARGDEMDWMKIDGVGVKLAQSVVKQVHGGDE